MLLNFVILYHTAQHHYMSIIIRIFNIKIILNFHRKIGVLPQEP